MTALALLFRLLLPAFVEAHMVEVRGPRSWSGRDLRVLLPLLGGLR